MSSDDLTIRDSSVTFGTVYPEIKRGFEMLSGSVSDTIANIETIDATIIDINSLLDSSLCVYHESFNKILTKIESANNELAATPIGLSNVGARARAYKAEINMAENLTGSLDPINTMDTIVDITNNLSSQLGLRSITVYSGLNYYEECINKYNNGEMPAPDLNNFIDSYLDDDLLINATGVALRCVNEALKQIENCSPAVTMLLGVTANKLNKDPARAAGVFASNSITKILSFFDKSIPIWINSGVGTAICSIYTAADMAISDEGDWTIKDTERLAVATAGSAVKYLTWAQISGIIGAGIGGPVGGAIGMGVASLVLIPVGAFVDYIGDIITQDNIIDTFTYNGETYEVPRNGNGKNGTYDVLLERASKKYEEMKQDAGSRSYIENLEQMYDNWEVFLFQKSTSFRNDYNNGQIPVECIAQINEILDDVCKQKNPYDYFYDHYLYNSGMYGNTDYWAAAKIFEKYLLNDYRFDIDYYKKLHYY